MTENAVANNLKVTLVHSPIGHPADQKAAARSLGLHRLHQSVIVADTPSIRGAIRKIAHLLEVQPVDESGG